MSGARALVAAALLAGMALGAPATPPGARAAAPSKRIAFLIDSWYPNSHADVIGRRLLEGYRMGDRAYPSPVGVASVLTIAPRPTDRAQELASRYGVRVAGSVDEALLADPRAAQPRLGVDGVLIAVRTPLPATPPAEPSGQFRLFRDTLAVFDRVGTHVPVFVDKNLAATWQESQTIIAEGTKRGVPLMAGSVVPWVPLDPPLPTGRRPQVAVAVAAAPYDLYAIHVADLLQAVVETRGPRETGVAWVRDVGRGFWSMPEGAQWGRDILETLLATARTRRGYAPRVPEGLKDDVYIVLVQYVDGTKGVVALMTGQFDDAEFRVGIRYEGQGAPYIGGLVLGGAPYDHFGYLVHALVQFYTTGRPVAPAERTLLSTGISLMGMQSRQTGGQTISSPTLAVTYAVFNAFNR
jgi:hypothetical protein